MVASRLEHWGQYPKGRWFEYWTRRGEKSVTLPLSKALNLVPVALYNVTPLPVGVSVGVGIGKNTHLRTQVYNRTYIITPQIIIKTALGTSSQPDMNARRHSTSLPVPLPQYFMGLIYYSRNANAFSTLHTFIGNKYDNSMYFSPGGYLQSEGDSPVQSECVCVGRGD